MQPLKEQAPHMSHNPHPPRLTRLAFFGPRAVAILVALFLVVSAGLKLHSLLYRPFAAGSPFLSRTMEYALLEVEVLLALWLLSGWRRSWAWLATSVTFGVFALASLYMAWLGRSSCGCFGEVQVSPWITFGIDCAVLAVLFLFRPREQEATEGQARWIAWRPIAAVAGGMVALLAVACLILTFAGISPAQALARLRGDHVTVEPATVDGGTAPRGTLQKLTLHLQNNTDHPIRITGGTTDCSCVATDDLPLTIPAGEQRPLHVRVKFNGNPGVFKRTYWLYTDDPQQPLVLAWITGSVVASP